MRMFDYTQDFINDLDDLPGLPGDERSEWVHIVRSSWIEGISLDDQRENPNAIVRLQRTANNEDGFEDVQLDYEVAFEFGLNWNDMHQLSMDPRAAISLGQHLIEAGTAAMRDLGKHAFFKTGAITETDTDGEK